MSSESRGLEIAHGTPASKHGALVVVQLKRAVPEAGAPMLRGDLTRRWRLSSDCQGFAGQHFGRIDCLSDSAALDFAKFKFHLGTQLTRLCAKQTVKLEFVPLRCGAARRPDRKSVV